MFPAIFLDRDGVINENRPDYVRMWSDVEIFPQALQALARLKHSPFKIVVVTNQSIIGRGMVPLEEVEEINRKLILEVERAGGRIDAILVCPHAPTAACDCRKPKPGLLRQAAQALSIDLSQSILVGDAISDLKAGLAAGVKAVALVRTGRGEEQSHSVEASQLPPFQVYGTLAEALANLVQPAPQHPDQTQN